MNLTIYDTSNIEKKRAFGNEVWSITCNRRYGQIAFSMALLNELNITAKQKISFAFDEDGKKWYLNIGDNKQGFKINLKYKPNGSYCKTYVCCQHVVRKILDYINANTGASLLIAKVPVDIDGISYYPILTNNPLWIK